MAEEDDDDLPYSQRAAWKDVVPVPQDDGENPLAVIQYPPGFQEVHSYFRAVQQQSEFSPRALRLTADVVEQNSANYTAWYYRRRCLKELGSDLDDELEFTDRWARDCPKNYQVWYHRRWIIMEMAEKLRKMESAEEAESAIKELGQRELEYHLEVMQVNDDFKNYNGWSHRQFIVSRFKLWEKEMAFVEQLLLLDIRNNSAWNHRFTVVRNTSWPLTPQTRQREIDYALKQIKKCASNESAWNYLSAFFGDGEGKVPWGSVPAVEALCRQVIELAPEPQARCRHAVEALAQVEEAQGHVEAALEQYALLKEIDSIRTNYWDWKSQLLRGQGAAAAACQ